MSDFEIDFEWPVAKYEFKPASPKAISAWRRRSPEAEELQGIPESEWPMLLGYIVAINKPRPVRPKAEAIEKAVKALVECKETPFHKVALTVARTLGTLMESEDSILLWRTVADRLRLMFEGKSNWPHRKPTARLGIFLVPGSEGGLKLSLQPENLSDALILCAARMIATGTTFNSCENCNTPFLSGGAGRKQKRGDARFCSSECRWKHHNEMRRKAKRKS